MELRNDRVYVFGEFSAIKSRTLDGQSIILPPGLLLHSGIIPRNFATPFNPDTMAAKFVVFCAAIAAANAGLLGAPAALSYSAGPALSYAAHAPALSYASHAPALSYAAHAPATLSYAAAPALSYAAHAPALSYSSAPALSYAAHAPAYSYAAAPAIGYAAPAAITSQSSNILRSAGNLAQVSTYSKTIDTPFSSVSKSDVRVSNPGVYSTLSYAAPATLGYAAHAPATLSYAAHAPVIAKTAVAAPAYSYGAPAVAAPGPVVAHATFSGLGTSYAW